MALAQAIAIGTLTRSRSLTLALSLAALTLATVLLCVMNHRVRLVVCSRHLKYVPEISLSCFAFRKCAERGRFYAMLYIQADKHMQVSIVCTCLYHVCVCVRVRMCSALVMEIMFISVSFATFRLQFRLFHSAAYFSTLTFESRERESVAEAERERVGGVFGHPPPPLLVTAFRCDLRQC